MIYDIDVYGYYRDKDECDYDNEALAYPSCLVPIVGSSVFKKEHEAKKADSFKEKFYRDREDALYDYAKYRDRYKGKGGGSVHP